MTSDAAFASFLEQELGSITLGKKADFVVIDRDIMTIPERDILLAKVVATVVDGKVIYGDLRYPAGRSTQIGRWVI
jgi:predicted amidohydrolase YtcJ